MNKHFESYGLTVGQLIDALGKFDRNNRLWIDCRGEHSVQMIPKGMAGNYDREYSVEIDEGSYQNCVYIELKK